MNSPRSDTACNFEAYARPVVAAAWRARFKIPSQNLNEVRVTAHVFDTASLKVLDVANMQSESLYLEIFPRSNVWPTSFKSSPPSDHDIALIFFSSGRDEEILDSLLKHAISADLALKGEVAESELLIFTSVHLPDKARRFQGKLYFWGFFMGHGCTSSHDTDNHVQLLSSRTRQILSPDPGRLSFVTVGSSFISSREHNQLADPEKSERRGRRLDAAWEHARPLDALRQKSECKYCGFFSSHGGISRLKAHLGGGDPRIHLPGCTNVPPQIKKVMAEWFINWVRATKAVWTKEIRETLSYGGGIQHDAPWGPSKPFGDAGVKRDDEHLDFGFLQSHASNHHANTVCDSKVAVKSWPKSSPETSSISTKARKTRTCASDHQKGVVAAVKISRDGSQEERRGRPLDDAWNHAKPLDEARQKTQCRYCGFISSYGGISRLKAHLGGGSPHIQLLGCPRAPVEVKSAMGHWFNDWSKHSNACWARKHPGGYTGSAPFDKRASTVEDEAWEHGIPVDETGQAIKCRHCGFVSKRGGIARLRVHLSGGDRTMQLEGCPDVPPEVRLSMGEQEPKKRKKKSTSVECSDVHFTG